MGSAREVHEEEEEEEEEEAAEEEDVRGGIADGSAVPTRSIESYPGRTHG